MNPLHSRTTSGFALSISTGFAMETLFVPRQAVYDPQREAPKRIPVSDYGQLWINVLTLIRNAYNALEKDLQLKVSPLDMVEVIHQEIDLIRDLLRVEGQNLCQPIFYLNSYDQLLKGLSDIFQLRVDKTPLQLQARWVYEQSRLLLVREDPSIVVFKGELFPSPGVSAIVLSHMTPDLLSYPRFSRLDLLESHTGKLKDRFEWNSKYHRLDDPMFQRLPFCRHLLYLFGDSAIVAPVNIKYRRQILELVKDRRWSPSMTIARVQADLERHFKDDPIQKDLRRIPTF